MIPVCDRFNMNKKPIGYAFADHGAWKIRFNEPVDLEKWQGGKEISMGYKVTKGDSENTDEVTITCFSTV